MPITKSDYLKGRQCPLRLWLAKQGVPEPSMESEEVWEGREQEGAAVEALVESLYPESTRIDERIEDDDEPASARDPTQAAARTASAIQTCAVVFQACFQTDELLTVSDLVVQEADGWRILEVKASTEPVPLHDWDLAFQWEVAERCGVNVSGVGIWHLNPKYARPDGPIDARELMSLVDRTAEVSILRGQARAEIEQMIEMLAGGAPNELPGPRCKGGRSNKAGDRPSSCGHLSCGGYCGRALPLHWAGRLSRLSGKKADFVTQQPGLSLEDLDPDDRNHKWTHAQSRAIRAVKSGEIQIDRNALAAELDKLEYPVAYVDFEFDPGMAIPRFAGMKPYSRLPFQWSVHIQPNAGAALETPDPFLHTDHSDPRDDFIDSLLQAVPPQGSIVVHSKAAERTVLRQLAEHFGGTRAKHILALDARLYDTFDLLNAGYYHPDQQGSYSIKRVAPLLLEHGYEDLAIQDGMAAVLLWQRACDPSLDQDKRGTLRRDLLAYCGRDTELMHRIIECVREIAESK